MRLLGRQRKLVCNRIRCKLLRRLESQESLVRTLQDIQVPLNEDPQETAWWTTEAAEPQQQPDDAWWNGYDQWTGQGWSQGWNIWSNASWSNTKPTNDPTTVPTWSGNAKLFDDFVFDVLMNKRGSNPSDHCFLVPRLISGLTGRAREHLRMAGDLDRFAVDGGLEQFWEWLKKKWVFVDTGRGNAIQEVQLRDQTCER